MSKIIQIEKLIKNYDDVIAVDGISFDVIEGEMFGIVGPDGAGKTTTIRSLCGLLKPTEGNISILNLPLRENKKQIQNQIGYLSQKFSLYEDLSVDENIEFFAEIHGVKNYSDRRNELLEFTRLTQFRDRPAGKLSGGMKQKLALACSLIHRPKILFLDEPTTGVDPVSRRDFWKILSGLTKEGITIFMSTPYLDEAERCSRVAMMNKGKIISLDTPKNIKNSIDKKIIEIICPTVRDAYRIIRENFDYDVQLFGDRINVIAGDPESDYLKIEKALSEHSIHVSNYRFITPSLENVFIYLVKQQENNRVLK